jgi:O-antigen ligase
MRKLAWGLLLLFAFAIPWEYSLDSGEPLGNVARIIGLLLLLVAIPAILHSGRLRTPGLLQWVVLVFYLWFCCSYFWAIDQHATLERLRGYFQEMMIVWLIWEFAESPRDLRALLRAYVAGSWVLAALTVANLASAEAMAAGQTRVVAVGQDPNDVARFLDIGIPLAALLVNCEPRWPARVLALGYLPLGLVAVLLTASRGGFLAALVALAGSALLFLRRPTRAMMAAAFVLPVIAFVLWFGVPHETFERLTTIPAQMAGGDLNQRLNIWDAGWHAFVQAPWLGTGAGSFVAAAGMNPQDTAHNSVLSILVGGGLCALFIAACIVAATVWGLLQTRGPLLLALATALSVWALTSLVATVEESRTTWLLLGAIALAGRLAREEPQRLAACFADRTHPSGAALAGPAPAAHPAL